ncbi:MAG: hypothetical protein R3220_03145 [Balneolaceae bacterium]|nr:hypothetical protein [Balneolaceae bacterium]
MASIRKLDANIPTLHAAIVFINFFLEYMGLIDFEFYYMGGQPLGQ